MKSFAFLSGSNGTGNTTLVFNVINMLASQDKKILAVDLAPRADLSAMLMKIEENYDIYINQEFRNSRIQSAEAPRDEINELIAPDSVKISNLISLVTAGPQSISENFVAGDLKDITNWENSPEFKKITSFVKKLHEIGESENADFCIIDTGRCSPASLITTLLAADYLVVSTDTDSKNLDSLRETEVQTTNFRKGLNNLLLSEGKESLLRSASIPAGYVILQQKITKSDNADSYPDWMSKIPKMFYTYILENDDFPDSFLNDPYCLAMMKFNPGLMYLALKSGKPIFNLKPADGALGAQVSAVMQEKREFNALTNKLISLI